MVNLLTAFALYQFDAHWLWWVAFVVYLLIEVSNG